MGNKEAETDFQKRLPIMSRRTQVGAAPQGVRFQRSGCRTANGQGVVFGRHIQYEVVMMINDRMRLPCSQMVHYN